MNYISTRNNHDPVNASRAIVLGMVPEGGLFVPETLPRIDPFPRPGASYQEVARTILTPLLTDFSARDLDHCIAGAYNPTTFDSEAIVDLVPLDSDRSILELWHGPTAAFKDVALQIMPHFLSVAKRNLGDTSHTVILVATSGDTGKAALEGFKDCEGISIIVFFPHEGVSEIQELQMTTTDGRNTYVVAVKGNFDDCQSASSASSAVRSCANGFSGSAANSRRPIRSTGAGCAHKSSITGRRTSVSSNATSSAAASPLTFACPPAISEISLPATTLRAWGCPSIGSSARPTKTTCSPIFSKPADTTATGRFSAPCRHPWTFLSHRTSSGSSSR